jgi:hypothetical protein
VVIPSSPHLFAFFVHSWHLDLEATFNDWPIHKTTRDAEPNGMDTVVSWLVCEGERNEAEVRVRGSLDVQSWVHALLWRGDRTKDERVDFARYRYRTEREPRLPRDVEERWVSVVRHRFTARTAFGPWAWERADRYEDRHRPKVEALIQELRVALEARDAGRVCALFETKLDHQARTKGLDPAVFTKIQRNLLERFFASPEYRVEWTEPVRFEGRNRGRLVLVETPEGRSPIVIYGLDGALEMNTIPSIIGGEPRFVH